MDNQIVDYHSGKERNRLRGGSCSTIQRVNPVFPSGRSIRIEVANRTHLSFRDSEHFNMKFRSDAKR